MTYRRTNVLILFSLVIQLFATHIQGQSGRGAKAFIHTDQPYYLSGQVLQYSICLSPSDASEVLFVSLWNEKLEMLMNQRVGLKEGVAQGTLQLPASLPTGKYLLVAYNNLMLFYSTENFEKKPFSVFNPEDPILPGDNHTFEAAFFPEGNRLIAGHNNKIAFRFSDDVNDIEGLIVNQNRDTVSRFKSLQHGYGVIYLSARPGDTYSAHVAYRGEEYSFPIGSAKTDQAAFRLIGANTDTLNVLVNIGDDYAGDSLTLLVKNQGQAILGATQLVNKPAISFVVPKSLLGNGINQLLLLNESDKVISQRLVHRAFDSDISASIKTTHTTLKTRSKVAIPVELKTTNGPDTKANLSVSIKSINYFPGQSSEKMEMLNLFSELNFTATGRALAKALEDPAFLDLFLLTKSLSPQLSPGSAYALEQKKLIPLLGRVTADGKPVTDSTVYISILSEKPQFKIARLNKDGIFKLLVSPFTGESELIIKLAQVDESLQNIKYELIEARPKLSPSDFESVYVPGKSQLNKFLQLQSDNQLIGRNYYAQAPEAIETATDLGAFFFDYNFDINYSDYLTLNDFREIKRELIEQLYISRNEDVIRVMQYDNTKDLYTDPYEKAPLMLIDGLPVFDAKKVLNLDPAKIKDIRVMNMQYLVGGIMFEGVLEITTLQGNYFLQGETNHKVFTLQGYHQSNATGLPNAEVLESGNLPDFRSVLYWNPSLEVTTGERFNLEFHTSDDIGQFLLEIVGMDEQGNLIHFEKLITVK